MSQKNMVTKIFPKQIDNSFQGNRIALIVFFLITAFTIVRSCIHIFAPDGGASSIAGINIPVEGGPNIVSLFAFWGLSQLLLGLVCLAAAFRYRSLIPFMYLLIIGEYFGRILIGLWKPLTVTHIPPGAYGDYMLVPLATTMLILSIRKPDERGAR